MRAVLSVLSLLMVVAVVGWLVKKQTIALPLSGQPTASQAFTPAVTPHQQSQMLQDKVKKSVEEAMQTPRRVNADH